MPPALLLFFLLGTAASEKIVSCYVRPGIPPASKIDAFLCTHLMIIGPAGLNDDGTARLPAKKVLEPIVALKKQNPRLKVFLTLLPKNPVMSALVTNAPLMETFVANVTTFLEAEDLDGFDLDWEFPVWNGAPSDREGLSALLRALRSAFDASPRPLGLSLAVSAPFTITKKAYDVAIMNYDFHFFSKTTPFTGLNAPLRALKYEILVLKKLNSVASLSLSSSPTFFRPSPLPSGSLADSPYGSSSSAFRPTGAVSGFSLTSSIYPTPPPWASPTASETLSPSLRLSLLKKSRNLVFAVQVCAALNSSEFSLEWSDRAASPYFHGARQWVSFEDVRSVTAKAAFAKELDARGIMLFDLANDDFEAKCALGATYPLIRAAKKTFLSPLAVQEH
uniref:Glyco_18 domain-containing protein n=1 Tax=Steinernema glaseri TaxID=37863 RepID=A0A1I7ZH98_9BILA